MAVIGNEVMELTGIISQIVQLPRTTAANEERLVVAKGLLDLPAGVPSHSVARVLLSCARAGTASDPECGGVRFLVRAAQHIAGHSIVPGVMRDPWLTAGVGAGTCPVHVSQVEPSMAQRPQSMSPRDHCG